MGFGKTVGRRKNEKGGDNIIITTLNEPIAPEACKTCLQKHHEGCIYPEIEGNTGVSDCPFVFDGRTLEFSQEEKAYMARQAKTLRRATPKPPNSLKFRKWRKRNGVKHCKGCKIRLTNEAHHMLCNKCWEAKNRSRQ